MLDPAWTRRGVCPDCGDYVCLLHMGHIGEACLCWSCDDCRDLSDDLIDGLCPRCRSPYGSQAPLTEDELAQALGNRAGWANGAYPEGVDSPALDPTTGTLAERLVTLEADLGDEPADLERAARDRY